VDNDKPKKSSTILSLQTPSKRKQPAPVENQKNAANIAIKSKAAFNPCGSRSVSFCSIPNNHDGVGDCLVPSEAQLINVCTL
jgi:hypothetical protein